MKKKISNPFLLRGYISPDYFCDREDETTKLIELLRAGNNITLISTRRMGKTGLITHCFNNTAIQQEYYTFFVDIYATKTLRDFVFLLSKEILEKLKPFGKKAMDIFVQAMKSLQTGVSFDMAGTPSFNINVSDIQSSEKTLDEIFKYLKKADKPCIIAIDEFQQIDKYREDNVEALLRTHIQHCNNAQFIFAGSQHHTMGNMFLSAARPFYMSSDIMYLSSIPLDKYTKFAVQHFKRGGKKLLPEVMSAVYEQFEGITWYVQKVLNVLYGSTPQGSECNLDMLPWAYKNILNSNDYTYQEIIFRLPEKQQELLVAMAKEKTVRNPTSGEFVKKYKLQSASSVQSALRVLSEKDYITQEMGCHKIYDRFFALWLRENY